MSAKQWKDALWVAGSMFLRKPFPPEEIVRAVKTVTARLGDPPRDEAPYFFGS
jgi:hypothetical protein